MCRRGTTRSAATRTSPAEPSRSGTGQDAERLIRWEEREGGDVVEMAVAFADSESGAATGRPRTRLARTTAGQPPPARWLGWVEAVLDLAVTCAPGVTPRRRFNWRSTTSMEVVERTGGLEVMDSRRRGWAARSASSAVTSSPDWPARRCRAQRPVVAALCAPEQGRQCRSSTCGASVRSGSARIGRGFV